MRTDLASRVGTGIFDDRGMQIDVCIRYVGRRLAWWMTWLPQGLDLCGCTVGNSRRYIDHYRPWFCTPGGIVSGKHLLRYWRLSISSGEKRNLSMSEIVFYLDLLAELATRPEESGLGTSSPY